LATWAPAPVAHADRWAPPINPSASSDPRQASGDGAQDLVRDLDAILTAPVLSRALVAVRLDSLRDGTTLYARHADKLVVPASNMKLVTMAVAAARLGWDFRFRTTLESAGAIAGGTLRGDLIVTGSGDPTIVADESGPALLFDEWADALARAGIRRVEGRLVGDDNAFDDVGLGAGWAWDYAEAGYAAPAGALSYNENTVTVRIAPAPSPGQPALVTLFPAGSGLTVDNAVVTGAAGAGGVSIALSREPGSPRLAVRGRIASESAVVSRTTTVPNPTRYFVEGLRERLAERGLVVSGGAWDIDDLPAASIAGATGRQLVAARESWPLSSVGGRFIKSSQNFYGEMLLKAIGRAATREVGTAAGARAAVRESLAAWGVPADAIVMNDGSGLSRYDYVTADLLVTLLTRVWRDESLRGPFVALLPVGGKDGTLASRMRSSTLDGRVQAKTGTIANMRALSGYLDTRSGDKVVFAIVANHFTGAVGAVDEVAERVLERVYER
jgi:D-alanyl-D-alanine carboxypeptidase/D-alanyl-D-alanine-endopeptidase (penicillin-binding protein 4)